VLAIAIVGAVALIVFASSLADRTAALDLSLAARQSLQQEADRLGETAVPDTVATGQETAVAQAIDRAFVDTFQTVMSICTGLAWLSASMAAWLIPAKERGLPDRTGRTSRPRSQY
jgi:hypothetical protein